MKLAIASDLHLEFGPIVLENTEGADVLILSGDICVAADLQEHDDGMPNQKSKRIHDFFYTCCNNFPHVVYVVGNHEHYHYDFKYTITDLKKKLKYLPNLQILDKETWTLHDEITFIGGTLWTDMNKEDPLTLAHINGAMNDFRCVRNSNRMKTYNVPLYKKNPLWTEDGLNGSQYFKDEKGNMEIIAHKKKKEPSRFSPEDAVKDHKKMLEFIHHVYQNKPNSKYVVVGHHAPSLISVHSKYKHDTLMNGGYTSDLDEFIERRPNIKLWTHGHMHDPCDYLIGDTRVVCNPRGYIGYEQRANEFKLKFIEV